MSDSNDPTTLRELTERAERSWQGWVEAIEGIPDERLAEPMVGHWSGKDLLGHVAFWEDWGVGESQRLLAEQPETGEDMDAVNERQVEESKNAVVAAQKRYRDEAHGRLMAFLRTIPEDSPHLPEVIETIGSETYGHFDEHAAQVRAWREAEGL